MIKLAFAALIAATATYVGLSTSSAKGDMTGTGGMTGMMDGTGGMMGTMKAQ
jgi:hypothetical protein